jgi:hypothetical protein
MKCQNCNDEYNPEETNCLKCPQCDNDCCGSCIVWIEDDIGRSICGLCTHKNNTKEYVEKHNATLKKAGLDKLGILLEICKRCELYALNKYGECQQCDEETNSD